VLSGEEIPFSKRELGPQKIYDDMSVTSGDKRPSYSTVKNWVPGRLTQVTILLPQMSIKARKVQVKNLLYSEVASIF
jgi:hypothetical protein